MKKPMRLQTKITLLIVTVVFICISIVIAFSISQSAKNIEEEIRSNIMNVAKMTANYEDIRIALKEKDPQKIIAPQVASLLHSVSKVEYIVVADMAGIRYSHPNPDRIGERFVGGDELRVLADGETYVSEAVGTLGKSLRVFTPIYDLENKRQIGFVSVGTLSQSIGIRKRTAAAVLMLAAIASLTIGVGCAFFLAKNIKNTLLGLEPEEISKLYNEKMGMLDTLYEGIVAIDQHGKISLINDSALKILNTESNYEKSEIIGMDIDSVLPSSSLMTVLETGLPEYDREQRINDTIVMTNRVPIRSRGIIVGAIASFREKNEITKLAEELTGVRLIVEALRANSHEFLNKLHVILGLIHMGDLEEAKKYITTITQDQQRLLSIVTSKIKDPSIAGLILGKFSRASELGINLKIDEATWLQRTHGNINSNTLVIIIGNLIENAMEAVIKRNDDDKYVHVRIHENLYRIEIDVTDTGIGMTADNIDRIFERGYTTKAGSVGTGLALLKDSIDILKGEITVSSDICKGSKFTVIIPKDV